MTTTSRALDGFVESTINVYNAKDEPEPYRLRSLRYMFKESTGVALVFFNQPEHLNPFRANTHHEMFCVLLHMKRDDRVRVCIWTGAGRAFSCGADFSETMKGTPEIHVPQHIIEANAEREMAPLAGDFAIKRITMAFYDFDKPLILAINGVAVGMAANMLTCCDIAYCAPEARFGYPFIKLGILPEMGSTLSWPAVSGNVAYKRLAYTGGWMSAQEAERYLLINGIVPQEQLLPTCLKDAELIAENSATGLKLCKKLINGATRDKVAAQLDLENKAFEEAMSGPDFMEAMMKFVKARSKGKKKQSKL